MEWCGLTATDDCRCWEAALELGRKLGDGPPAVFAA
jgi:hypothetical protein